MGNQPESDSRLLGESEPDPPGVLPRLVPDEPLPTCAYVPGRTARPVESPAESIAPEAWATCRSYLLGIDLFNHGYYWEAHERWEAVWLAVGRRGKTADFLKGLIKLTAAFVKAREGRSAGVARHARRASELFAVVASDAAESDRCGGLNLKELDDEASRIASLPELVVDTRQSPVCRLTQFVMRPACAGQPASDLP